MKLYLIGSLVALFMVLTVIEAAEKPSSDIRVLVDISGSMKQNDPDNLRIPAIQMFSQLLPPDSQAGVWTFGQYVNMLVPLDAVSSRWKDVAVNASKQINSTGLYTNIGGVLERATFGWSERDETVDRTLILLTDGVVDISKDQQANNSERRRIIDEILPKLRASGVVIHTIALSGDADEALLAQIAAQTDGWYQKVMAAEQLQKVFLKIFGQATERDSIPLENNTFSIDEQVTEFTLLVFKSDSSQPTQLSQPNGDRLDASKDGPKISWFESDGYDLITISEPSTGLWKVEAELDPDNRVLVVSNIKVNTSDIPNNLLANEIIDFSMWLTQDNQVLTEETFLQLISMQLELSIPDVEQVIDLVDEQQTTEGNVLDGIYSAQIKVPDTQGIAELTSVINSPTFQRLRQQAVNIHASPIKVEHVINDDPNGFHSLYVSPIERLVKPESLIITATTRLPDGRNVSTTLTKDAGFRLRGKIEVTKEGGDYGVLFKVTGETQNGRSFEVEPPAYQFSTESLIPDPEPEPVITQKPLPEEEVKPEDAEINWVKWFVIAIGFNIISFILIWLGRFISKKQKLALAKKLGEQLENTNE